MKEISTFAIQTLVVTLVLNAILVTAIFFVGGAFVTFGVGFLVTMLLWFAIQSIGKRLLGASPPAEAASLPKEPSTLPKPPTPQVAPPPTEASAIQILSILQRQGRLIDFLQEDLSQYEDAQIGAAVRNIHEGCKKALSEYVTLEPIVKQEEGSSITVNTGFNAREIRLTGNITGDPPFKGALRHRGWRVAKIDLPTQTPAQQKERIVAAAEVEVNA